MTWFVAIVALIGAYLNARTKVSGFVLWIFTNSFWVYHNINIGQYAQAMLYAAFLLTAVYGLFNWLKIMKGE